MSPPPAAEGTYDPAEGSDSDGSTLAPGSCPPAQARVWISQPLGVTGRNEVYLEEEGEFMMPDVEEQEDESGDVGPDGKKQRKD